MTYEIIRVNGTLYDLQKKVELRMAQAGAQPTGGPFYDGDSREWCQALTASPSLENEVRLREPKRK